MRIGHPTEIYIIAICILESQIIQRLGKIPALRTFGLWSRQQFIAEKILRIINESVIIYIILLAIFLCEGQLVGICFHATHDSGSLFISLDILIIKLHVTGTRQECVLFHVGLDRVFSYTKGTFIPFTLIKQILVLSPTLCT